jgi:hypothetical protein
MGIRVYPYTVTPVLLGPNFGNIGVRVNPNNIMVSCLEAVNHPTLYLTSIWYVYEVFVHLHIMWMGIWVHPSHTVIPVQVGPNFGILGVRVNPNNIMVSCLEAVNHHTLLLISILDVYEVFEHLHML